MYVFSVFLRFVSSKSFPNKLPSALGKEKALCRKVGMVGYNLKPCFVCDLSGNESSLLTVLRHLICSAALCKSSLLQAPEKPFSQASSSSALPSSPSPADVNYSLSALGEVPVWRLQLSAPAAGL